MVDVGLAALTDLIRGAGVVFIIVCLAMGVKWLAAR